MKKKPPPQPRPPIKAPVKAAHPQDCDTLEQLPNIGPSLATDLRLVGIDHPSDLIGRDGFALYLALCAKTGLRHDPCVLDAFLAACDFMRGAPPTPWWHYSSLRKSRYGAALRRLFGTHDDLSAPAQPDSPAVDAEEAMPLWHGFQVGDTPATER